MNSAIRTTIFMGILAIASAVVAAAYYPWAVTERARDMIGENLFEDYEADKVTWIEMTRYNPETSETESIRLRKRADKWIVPEKSNFEANQGVLLPLAINSLNDRMVSNVMDDTQQAHIEFGVVDPEEQTTVAQRAGIGTKIKLEDRGNQTIADLIVGKPVKGNDQLQHYVRIPGQTTVYVASFDANILATDFGDWVNPNLVQLSDIAGTGIRLNALTINNYRLDAEKLGSGGKPAPVYRAEFVLGDGDAGIRITVPDGEGNEQAVQLGPETRQLVERLAMWSYRGQEGNRPMLISATRLIDVIPKPRELVQILRAPKEDADESLFESMHGYGFRKTGFDGNFSFESVRGEIEIYSREGVLVTMLVGSIFGDAGDQSGSLTRLVMLTARVDPNAFQAPEKPGDEVDPNSDENRAYLRKVEDLKKKRQAATELARNMNRNYARWYYVLSEELVDVLIPAITVPPSALRPVTSSDVPDGEPEPDGDTTGEEAPGNTDADGGDADNPEDESDSGLSPEADSADLLSLSRIRR